MESLITKTKKLGWAKQPVSLEIIPEAEEKAKLVLLGKILSPKLFSCTVVKEIIAKARNTIKAVEVVAIDKNIFSFSFGHEVDVRRVWDRRPWSFKREHVILKKYKPEWSFNKVDFSVSDFWVQIYGLPLNSQNLTNLKKVGGFLGKVVEEDMAETGTGSCCKFVKVRVGIDVNRPLTTGFPLVREDLSVLWILFKFEKLGSFCYGCGILGHDIKDCADKEIQKLWKKGITLGVSGNWLRAENNEYQPGIDLEALSKVDIAECSKKKSKNDVESMVVAQSLWISAINLALNTRHDMNRREDMD
jgi:hypothetical protein